MLTPGCQPLIGRQRCRAGWRAGELRARSARRRVHLLTFTGRPGTGLCAACEPAASTSTTLRATPTPPGSLTRSGSRSARPGLRRCVCRSHLHAV